MRTATHGRLRNRGRMERIGAPRRNLRGENVKTRNRIATAVAVALASVFVASPAFAHAGHAADSMFSSAGQPVDAVAILIVGAVVLVAVLVLSGWIGSKFAAKG